MSKNITSRDYGKKHAKFVEWLTARGASILTPTNQWELARWVGNGVTSVIYTNAKCNVTFTGDSAAAWTAFSKGDNAYRAAPPAKRRGKSSPTIKALRVRDGDLCFFCLRSVNDDDASVEHLVPVTHGGPSHMSNLVLAHQSCNSDAGHLSAMEKINTRMRAVLELERGPCSHGETSNATK